MAIVVDGIAGRIRIVASPIVTTALRLKSGFVNDAVLVLGGFAIFACRSSMTGSPGRPLARCIARIRVIRVLGGLDAFLLGVTGSIGVRSVFERRRTSHNMVRILRIVRNANSLPFERTARLLHFLDQFTLILPDVIAACENQRAVFCFGHTRYGNPLLTGICVVHIVDDFLSLLPCKTRRWRWRRRRVGLLLRRRACCVSTLGGGISLGLIRMMTDQVDLG